MSMATFSPIKAISSSLETGLHGDVSILAAITDQHNNLFQLEFHHKIHPVKADENIPKAQ